MSRSRVVHVIAGALSGVLAMAASAGAQSSGDGFLLQKPVGQMAVLNGTVASPADAAQAEMLVKTLLNTGIDLSKEGALLNIIPVNRLKVATPLQRGVFQEVQP